MDFDAEGLIINGSNRVTSWNDSTSLGTVRVIVSDGGMKAYFDSVEMKVKSFRFTPFNYPAQQRNLGETYPFGGYNKKQ